jgi:hypothetical protein
MQFTEVEMVISGWEPNGVYFVLNSKYHLEKKIG